MTADKTPQKQPRKGRPPKRGPRKKATNLTLSETILEGAAELLDKRGYGSLTSLAEEALAELFKQEKIEVRRSKPGEPGADSEGEK